MQIFKRLREKNHCGQNLVEFVFIIPMLIFLSLIIFEVSVYWQEVNAVSSLNTEINANAALADTKNMEYGITCPAAVKAKLVLEQRGKQISVNDPIYSFDTSEDPGKPPFVLYKIISNTTVTTKDGIKPQVTLWVDCRNPYENGITTQIYFYHKTLIFKAYLPSFDKSEPIEVIPENIFVTSTKLNTIRHY